MTKPYPWLLVSLTASLTPLTVPMRARAQYDDWQAAEDSGAISQEAPDEGVDLGSGVDARRRREERGRLWVEGAFFYRSSDVFSVVGISPAVGAELRPSPAFMVDAYWGFPGAVVTPEAEDGETAFRLGNPYLGGYWIGGTGEAVWIGWQLGGGLAFPVARSPGSLLDPSTFARVIAQGAAFAMRGSRDPWLWVPEYIGLVLPSAKVTFQGSRFEAALAVDVGTLIDTSGADPARDTEAYLQWVGEGGLRATPDVTVGLRLSGLVRMTASSGDDRLQSAADVFVRGRADTAFLELDLAMNLDDPNGFAFDDDGFWGLVLTIGGIL